MSESEEEFFIILRLTEFLSKAIGSSHKVSWILFSIYELGNLYDSWNMGIWRQNEWLTISNY